MSSILSSISGGEAAEILRRLCASDAQLRARIEAEAEKVLREIDVDEVADGVCCDLEMIDVEELWQRSGPTRYGYTEPVEMAVEMLEEALRPHEDRIAEYRKIGMLAPSMQYCMGVLKGIYRFEHESKTEFKDWAVDIPGECFGGILAEWQRTCTREDDAKEMKAFVAHECPDWAE